MPGEGIPIYTNFLTLPEKVKDLTSEYGISDKNIYAWLKEQYNFSDLDSNVVKIETPLLDSTFDYIVFYAQGLKDNSIIITDDGWTIDNLNSYGINFDGRSKT
ncbi:DUF1828 domain-containing protein [Liquorilactobacillus vini]|uniref:DUF1828 domain-containing protein n=1 Tax=Liquorilactobacillus vini TaxID=238015 RepID=UPI00159EC71C|nr:DUF1828 domain-containing protein [Liquorilactobacillus vini]